MKLSISVISGFDEGFKNDFSKFPISIGRHKDNEFCLSDPTVSRFHCIIYKEDNSFILSDLKSLNHTFLNGKPVHLPEQLEHDSKLSVGSNIILISIL